jgi:hypothetical protein
VTGGQGRQRQRVRSRRVTLPLRRKESLIWLALLIARRRSAGSCGDARRTQLGPQAKRAFEFWRQEEATQGSRDVAVPYARVFCVVLRGEKVLIPAEDRPPFPNASSSSLKRCQRGTLGLPAIPRRRSHNASMPSASTHRGGGTHSTRGPCGRCSLGKVSANGRAGPPPSTRVSTNRTNNGWKNSPWNWRFRLRHCAVGVGKAGCMFVR